MSFPDTQQIIVSSREYARLAKSRGVASVRLPVMGFAEWARFFDRTDDLAARERHRGWQKRNFYFKRFLEAEGIAVTVITCPAQAVRDWAEAHGHPMTSEDERTHVLAHYVNQPDLPPAQCVHQRPLTAAMAGSGITLYGTVTWFGEGPDRPEVLSTVVHTRDGWVVESLELLGADHTVQEAFGLATEFLSRHGVRTAFQDPDVRRPEFCPDCGELLVHTAGPQEYGRVS